MVRAFLNRSNCGKASTSPLPPRQFHAMSCVYDSNMGSITLSDSTTTTRSNAVAEVAYLWFRDLDHPNRDGKKYCESRAFYS